jgi:UDP-glucose 4-epimerase
MKILVTGGAGFIGTNLIKRLLQESHEIHSLDNYSIGTSDNELEGCNYITGDLFNISLLDKDFDIIFHLAGLSRIQPSFTTPFETYIANAEGTQHVCEFARKINAKVIYAGSSSRWHNPYQSPYATYKHVGEEICKMYRTSFNVDIEIARFYNAYGPYEVVDGDYAAVIGLWRRQIRDKEPITIVGDGEQRRDFTHVDDIVDGLCRIAFSEQKHEDAWELGTGFNFSLNEVYDMFNVRFKHDKVYLPDQHGNYRVTRRENNDAIERLGWKPENRLERYILSL